MTFSFKSWGNGPSELEGSPPNAQAVCGGGTAGTSAPSLPMVTGTLSHPLCSRLGHRSFALFFPSTASEEVEAEIAALGFPSACGPLGVGVAGPFSETALEHSKHFSRGSLCFPWEVWWVGHTQRRPLASGPVHLRSASGQEQLHSQRRWEETASALPGWQVTPRPRAPYGPHHLLLQCLLSACVDQTFCESGDVHVQLTQHLP